MKKSLLITLLLAVSFFSNAQTGWVNINATLQRKIVGTDTAYRHIVGSAGYVPIYDKRQINALITSSGGDVTTALANKVDKVAGSSLITDAEKTRLSGVQTGATANSTDAQLRDRTTHTGVQSISTITDLQSTLDSKANLTGATFTGDVQVPAIPAGSTSAITKNYVDNAITGITWKAATRVATTANITLSGTQTIDGVALVAGNRVLVKNQTDATQNGIYLVASGAWTRVIDADDATEIETATVAISLGTLNKNTQWTCNATGITLGVSDITFAQISGAGTYTNGNGLTLTGNVFAPDFTIVGTKAQQDINTANIATNTTVIGTKVTANTAITGATKTKITYDSNGLITNATDATTADINDSFNKRYVTDANLVTIANQSGINTGDQDLSSLAKLSTVQLFTADGTWTKPAGAKSVEVLCFGGGGGGGAGRKGASSTVRCGGGGGGAGAPTRYMFNANDLPSSVVITIGIGGQGGLSVTANSTNGNNGSDGTSTTFGAYLRGRNGTGGLGGTNSLGTGGNGATGIPASSQAGASASVTGGVGVSPTNSNFTSQSGASGGGITSGNVASAGGNGNQIQALSNQSAFSSNSGGINTSGGNGATPIIGGLGLGGGGGGSSITGNAGDGGDGSGYGGGGGGGGASVDGVGNSGKGGNGANGACRVTVFF